QRTAVRLGGELKMRKTRLSSAVTAMLALPLAAEAMFHPRRNLPILSHPSGRLFLSSSVCENETQVISGLLTCTRYDESQSCLLNHAISDPGTSRPRQSG